MADGSELKSVDLKNRLTLLRSRERSALEIAQAMPATPEYRKLAQEQISRIQTEIQAILDEIEDGSGSV